MRQTIETDKDQLVICRTGENQDPSIHWYKYKEEKLIENSKKNIISHPICGIEAFSPMHLMIIIKKIVCRRNSSIK